MEKLKSIVEWVYIHAVKTPEKLCVCSQNEEYTYSQFWKKIVKNAVTLAYNGVKKEDKVIIESSSTAAYFSVLFGVQLLGATAVPVEKGINDFRLKEISEEINPKLVLKGDYLLPVPEDIQERCSAWNVVFPDMDNVQEILYTSGTTGKPKGVMITYRIQSGISQNANHTIVYPADTVWFIATPTNHGGALRRTYMALMNGSTVVLHDGFKDIVSVFQLIDKYKATVLFLPPSIIHFMIIMCRGNLGKLDRQLDFIYSSGSVLLSSDKEQLNKILPSVRKYDVYSSTEAGDIGYIRYDNLPNNSGNKVFFKPFPLVEVFTTDAAGNQSVEGIIHIKSPFIMRGYFNSPNPSKNTFSSSDIGTLKEGCLFTLIGRKDDVCNINGLKVSCSEIEDKAEQFHGVREACCVFKDVDEFNKYLNLYVVSKKGCEINKEKLFSYLSTSLEAYKVPKNIYIVDEIPKTTNGKILKNKL